MDGQKLSKSGATSVDPVELAARYGSDALRLWFIRDVPRSGDADFREELIAARPNELADDLGNLVNRVVTLLRRFRPYGLGPTARPPDEARAVLVAITQTTGAIEDALDRFDFRAAADSLWSVVGEANRFVSTTRPWELAKAERAGDGAARARLDGVLAVLLDACEAITRELQPFLPHAAERIQRALALRDTELGRRLFFKADLWGSKKPVHAAAR